MKTQRTQQGKKRLTNVLAAKLPARLIEFLSKDMPLEDRLGDMSDKRIAEVAATLSDWQVTPQGTEGYRTAEVTLGGIATDALEARTLMVRSTPGLFFIGECVDVTGWLGGYNFQWAWSSAMACADAIRGGAA